MCSVVSNSLCPLWTLTCQAPLSMEFSRQEYWSGCHFLPHFFTQMYIRVGGSAVAKTTSSTITPSTLLFPVQLSGINWKVLYLIKIKKKKKKPKPWPNHFRPQAKEPTSKEIMFRLFSPQLYRNNTWESRSLHINSCLQCSLDHTRPLQVQSFIYK